MRLRMINVQLWYSDANECQRMIRSPLFKFEPPSFNSLSLSYVSYMQQFIYFPFQPKGLPTKALKHAHFCIIGLSSLEELITTMHIIYYGRRCIPKGSPVRSLYSAAEGYPRSESRGFGTVKTNAMHEDVHRNISQRQTTVTASVNPVYCPALFDQFP